MIDSELFDAARSGNTEAVMALVHRSEGSMHGRAARLALVWACEAGAIETAGALVDAGVNPNDGSDREHLPICAAASAGQFAIVHDLLNRGVDPNSMDPGNVSPLIAAASAGHRGRRGKSHVEVIQVLLQNGAEVNHSDVERKTALHFASLKGDSDAVHVLLEYGANPNQLDVFGNSPLRYAVSSGDSNTTAKLLDFGASVDRASNEDLTLVERAIKYGHPRIAALLTQANHKA